MLTLVPCNHFWIEVKSIPKGILALCKFPHCRTRGEFTPEEWEALRDAGEAANKPPRV